jgi:mono/diheme cytochrome c family protein
MAPLEATLDDAKLAAVLTYVRGNLGNKSPAITADQAKAFRQKWQEFKKMT